MFKRYREPQAGEFFVVFADTAGTGSDNCAVQFLSAKWLDVPIVYHSNVTASFMTPLIYEELNSIYDQTQVQSVVAFERNNGGSFELDRLARLNRYGKFRMYTMKNIDPYGRQADTGKLGWDTNSATRPKMLGELKDAIEGDLIHVYHRQTVNELFSFIIKPSGRAEAEVGAHDDLVMALAGAWQLYQTERPIKDSGGSNVVETMPMPGGQREAGILYAEGYDKYNG